MSLRQLTFDFNRTQPCSPKPNHYVSWRIRKLAERHRLSISQAIIVASEIGVYCGEARHA